MELLGVFGETATQLAYYLNELREGRISPQEYADIRDQLHGQEKLNTFRSDPDGSPDWQALVGTGTQAALRAPRALAGLMLGPNDAEKRMLGAVAGAAESPVLESGLKMLEEGEAPIAGTAQRSREHGLGDVDSGWLSGLAGAAADATVPGIISNVVNEEDSRIGAAAKGALEGLARIYSEGVAGEAALYTHLPKYVPLSGTINTAIHAGQRLAGYDPREMQKREADQARASAYAAFQKLGLDPGTLTENVKDVYLAAKENPEAADIPGEVDFVDMLQLGGNVWNVMPGELTQLGRGVVSAGPAVREGVAVAGEFARGGLAAANEARKVLGYRRMLGTFDDIVARTSRLAGEGENVVRFHDRAHVWNYLRRLGNDKKEILNHPEFAKFTGEEQKALRKYLPDDFGSGVADDLAKVDVAMAKSDVVRAERYKALPKQAVVDRTEMGAPVFSDEVEAVIKGDTPVAFFKKPLDEDAAKALELKGLKVHEINNTKAFPDKKPVYAVVDPINIEATRASSAHLQALQGTENLNYKQFLERVLRRDPKILDTTLLKNPLQAATNMPVKIKAGLGFKLGKQGYEFDATLPLTRHALPENIGAERREAYRLLERIRRGDTDLGLASGMDEQSIRALQEARSSDISLIFETTPGGDHLPVDAFTTFKEELRSMPTMAGLTLDDEFLNRLGLAAASLSHHGKGKHSRLMKVVDEVIDRKMADGSSVIKGPDGKFLSKKSPKARKIIKDEVHRAMAPLTEKGAAERAFARAQGAIELARESAFSASRQSIKGAMRKMGITGPRSEVYNRRMSHLVATFDPNNAADAGRFNALTRDIAEEIYRRDEIARAAGKDRNPLISELFADGDVPPTADRDAVLDALHFKVKDRFKDKLHAQDSEFELAREQIRQAYGLSGGTRMGETLGTGLPGSATQAEHHLQKMRQEGRLSPADEHLNEVLVGNNPIYSGARAALFSTRWLGDMAHGVFQGIQDFLGTLGQRANNVARVISGGAVKKAHFVKYYDTRYFNAGAALAPHERLWANHAIVQLRHGDVVKGGGDEAAEFLRKFDEGILPNQKDVERYVQETRSIMDELADVLGLERGKTNDYYSPHIFDPQTINARMEDELSRLRKARKDGSLLQVRGRDGKLYEYTNLGRDKTAYKDAKKLITEKYQDFHNRNWDALYWDDVKELNENTHFTHAMRRNSDVDIIEAHPDKAIAAYIRAAGNVQFRREALPALKKLTELVKNPNAKQRLEKYQQLLFGARDPKLETVAIEAAFDKMGIIDNRMSQVLRKKNLSVVRLATFMKELAFAKMIGLNPATAIINLTQSPLNIMGTMGSRYFGSAMLDVSQHLVSKQSTGKGSAEIEHVLQVIDSSGRKTEGRFVDAMLDDAQTELLKLYNGDLPGNKGGLMRVAAWLFQKSEDAGILVTGVAARRKAVEAMAKFKELDAAAPKALVGAQRDAWIWERFPKQYKDGVIMAGVTEMEKVGHRVRGELLPGRQEELRRAVKSVAERKSPKAAKRFKQENDPFARVRGQGFDTQAAARGDVPAEHLGVANEDPFAEFKRAIEHGTAGEMEFLDRKIRGAIDQLMFAYVNELRPAWAQSSETAKLMLQFQDYLRNEAHLWMNTMMANQGKRAFANNTAFMGALFAMGGPTALPFMSELVRTSDHARRWLNQLQEKELELPGLGWKIKPGSWSLEYHMGMKLGSRLSLGFGLDAPTDTEGMTLTEEVTEKLASMVPAMAVVADALKPFQWASSNARMGNAINAGDKGADALMAWAGTGDKASRMRAVVPRDSVAGRTAQFLDTVIARPSAWLMEQAGMHESANKWRAIYATFEDGKDLNIPGPDVWQQMPIPGATTIARSVLEQSSATGGGAAYPGRKNRPGLDMPRGLLGEAGHAGRLLLGFAGSPNPGSALIQDDISAAQEHATTISGAKARAATNRMKWLVQQGMDPMEAQMSAKEWADQKMPGSALDPSTMESEFYSTSQLQLFRQLNSLSGQAGVILAKTRPDYIREMRTKIQEQIDGGDHKGAAANIEALQSHIRSRFSTALQDLAVLARDKEWPVDKRREAFETLAASAGEAALLATFGASDREFMVEMAHQFVSEEGIYDAYLKQYTTSPQMRGLSAYLGQETDPHKLTTLALEYVNRQEGASRQAKARSLAMFVLASRGVDPQPLYMGNLRSRPGW